jgi:hypothetical protein
MPYLVVVLETSDSVDELNSKLGLAGAGSGSPALATAVANYLVSCQAGFAEASIEVTSRNADQAVSTDGGSSAQKSSSLA